MLQAACAGQGVLQALPQTTKQFAWAAYTAETPCSTVLEPTSRSTSYGQHIQLEFANTSSLAVQGLVYHVCTDVTWRQQGYLDSAGEPGRGKTTWTQQGYNDIGPVDTFLWFHNPCSSPATITFNVSRLEDGAPLYVPSSSVTPSTVPQQALCWTYIPKQ